MAPPYNQPFHYFRQDVEEYILLHRDQLSWRPNQISKTISTIWAGDPTLKARYAPFVGRRLGPGLPQPEPIPDRPYTETDLKNVKKGRAMPHRTLFVAPPVIDPVAAAQDNVPEDAAQNAVAEHDNEEENELEDPGEAEGPMIDDRNAGDPDNHALLEVEIEAAPIALANSVDKLPYDFWPQLPWSPEPNLPIALEKDTSKDPVYLAPWLAAKPLRSGEDESTWHGMCHLGSGGFGAAGLWVNMDEKKNVVDKMVVKDVKPWRPHMWRDPRNWRNRLPREIQTHRLVEERRHANPGACRHLVRSRGHRLFMRKTRYRIYLDHYQGNLWHALTSHHTREVMEGQLPEALIWYILRALSSACLILQRGTIAEEPIQDWKPITHLDILLPNIFLGLDKRKRREKDEENNADDQTPALPRKKQKILPSKAKKLPITQSKDDSPDNDAVEDFRWSQADWDNLPLVPVVADFGQAFYSLGDGTCPLSDNPEDYILNNDCTRYPPEFNRQNGPPWILLGEKTDVWSIGHCSWMLITHRLPKNGPTREDFPIGPEGTEVPLSSHHDHRTRVPHSARTVLSGLHFQASRAYSDELKALVKSCLEWEIDGRPTLRHILNTANRELNKPGVKEILMNWEGFRLRWPTDNPEFGIGDPVPDTFLPTNDPADDWNDGEGTIDGE